MNHPLASLSPATTDHVASTFLAACCTEPELLAGATKRRATQHMLLHRLADAAGISPENASGWEVYWTCPDGSGSLAPDEIAWTQIRAAAVGLRPAFHVDGLGSSPEPIPEAAWPYFAALELARVHATPEPGLEDGGTARAVLSSLAGELAKVATEIARARSAAARSQRVRRAVEVKAALGRLGITASLQYPANEAGAIVVEDGALPLLNHEGPDEALVFGACLDAVILVKGATPKFSSAAARAWLASADHIEQRARAIRLPQPYLENLFADLDLGAAGDAPGSTATQAEIAAWCSANAAKVQTSALTSQLARLDTLWHIILVRGAAEQHLVHRALIPLMERP